MPLNDDTGDEFSTHLEDEHIFDAHAPPGIEMLGVQIETDRGSGSYAEDGPLEVAEDDVMNDGEMLGEGLASEEGQSEIGDWSPEGGHIGGGPLPEFGLPQEGLDSDVMGSYAMYGPTEIGISADAQAEANNIISALRALQFARPTNDPNNTVSNTINRVQSALINAAVRASGLPSGTATTPLQPSEVAASSHLARRFVRNQALLGQYAEEGASEIGQYAEEGASEIGQYAEEGASEIGGGPLPEFGLPQEGLDSDVMGSYAMYGPTEIGGGNIQAPFESFMMGPTGMGADASTPAAVAKVVEKARDNRQPPPPMKCVDADAPFDPGYDDDVAEFLIGAAVATGEDQFPLTTQFMQRAGAGCPPRYVRVDTEESYQQFRAQHSPEMSELANRVSDLSARLDQHMHDPHAHRNLDDESGYVPPETGGLDGGGPDLSDDLSDDINDLVVLGEAVEQAEKEKHIDLWMPKRYDGLVTAWREGDNVCASLMLPGNDGTVKVCTSLEPIVKCVEEMSRHAAESGASATVVGVLPAMGCVLGAGTIMKEVAAAAPAIMDHPEAQSGAPFVVRIEPKVNPALTALAMLAMACRAGNSQACDEWERLGKAAPAPVRQAMVEGLALAKAAKAV